MQRNFSVTILMVFILSVVFLILVLVVNAIFLLEFFRSRLSEKELLFVEGLISLILGGLFFVPGLRNPVIGAKQHLLFGAPSVGPKIILSRGTIQLALALILTGFVLILLFLIT